MNRVTELFLKHNKYYLTENERQHLKELRPVWVSDPKGVYCPEELVNVVKYRMTVSKQTKRKKVSKD